MSLVIARHPYCGRIVAATFSDPSWEENARHMAEWLNDKAIRGYPTEPCEHKPEIGEWCDCFLKGHA